MPTSAKCSFRGPEADPYLFCHRPLIVEDGQTPLGAIVRKLAVDAQDRNDDVIDHDLILLWGTERRIITGADLLGRLMRGIVARRRPSSAVQAPLD